MRVHIMLWSCLALAIALSASAADKLRVVATLPELGAIAEFIGGAHVQVETLARGTEDPHFVDARPSFVRVLNRADALIEGGADLESGWLPPLVQNARNAKIASGKPGRIVASAGLQLLDVPAQLDRSQGDVHPFGNPHYMLDPVLARQVAGNIGGRFAELDAAHAADYNARSIEFTKQLEERTRQWAEQLRDCRNVKAITYHKSFDYLLKRFGIAFFDTIEPKPGVEPSPSHVTHLIQRAKAEGVKLVVAETFRPKRTGERVANDVGAAYVELPVSVGGDGKTKTYFEWMDLVVERLAAGCSGK